MSNEDASERDNLEESTRNANSNLQRLIEAIGGLLTGSGELLMRVQAILGGAKPAASAGDECAAPPPVERREE